MEQPRNTYLEDMALPESREKPQRGWDVDREFGEGMKDALSEYCSESFQHMLDQKFYPEALGYAAWSKVLFGAAPGTLEQVQECLQIVEKGLFTGDDPHLEELDPLDDRVLNAAEEVAEVAVLTGRLPQLTNRQRELLEKSCLAYLQFYQGGGDIHRALKGAMAYRFLTGVKLEEINEEFFTAVKDAFLLAKESTGTPDIPYGLLTPLVTGYRLVKAYDIHLIPGQGIEIIDDPPGEFESKVNSLPEERKF